MDPPITPEIAVRPSCQRLGYPIGHDRFRQIFRDHWEQWVELHMEEEVPVDQRAYVKIIVLRLMLAVTPKGVTPDIFALDAFLIIVPILL